MCWLRQSKVFIQVSVGECHQALTTTQPSSEVDCDHTTVSSGACSAKRSAASKHNTSDLNISFSSQYCRKETFYYVLQHQMIVVRQSPHLLSQLILHNKPIRQSTLLWRSSDFLFTHLLSSFHRLSPVDSFHHSPGATKRCQCTTAEKGIHRTEFDSIKCAILR